MALIDFTGRILFLSDNPQIIERQFAGEDFALVDAGALRDDVSTDEITPVHVLTVWDDRLGRVPYVGFAAGGRNPIGIDAVKNGGFSVTVAGKRYGKGSSREHSPLAERSAGIRLVIAESFERIYRQNADNIGLFTSTDFSLVERLQCGEAIGLEELVASRDALAAAILRHGGLLHYGRERMRHITVPTSPAGSHPRTLTEKILARHLVVAQDADAPQPSTGTGAFVRADWRFMHEAYTGMCAHMLHSAFGRPLVLHEPLGILAFEDHMSYLHRSPAHISRGLIPAMSHMVAEHRRFVADYGLRGHGALPGGEGSEGISHPILTELHALPGQVVVGTDSHTTHSGALGCIAFGVGSTELANSLVTGAVRITMPRSLRVELTGRVPAGVTAKDIVLHLLATPRIKAGAGVGKVFEFAGDVVTLMSTDERATLTNMTAELGGFTGIVAPDAETVRFLRERRGIEFTLEPWMCSDPGADYAETIRVDCSNLSPIVASPGDPGNGVALSSLDTRPEINIAYGGSCTAGKREDFDRYHEVLAWAVAHDLRVKPGVKLYLQFGTTAVRDYCSQQGYLQTFEAVGAEILQPSCGACANFGPGASTDIEQVTISAINRNFPGRSGPGKVWLASAPTVVASAIAGEIVSFEELRGRHAAESAVPVYPETSQETSMRFFLSGRRAFISACLAFCACTPASYAQDTRPLRVIVPNQAGSGVDTIARAMSNALASSFGRSVVIENLPGSGGMTGTVQIVTAPKDGSAIGIVSSNHAINPFIYKKMPFDSVKDITPISVIAAGPVVLVVNPDQVEAETTREFIAELRAKAKDFSYGSAGNGTVLHLAAEYFNSEAKVDVTHVPYKGTGALTVDLIGGQVQYAMLPLSTALPHVKAGKLRAIGISSTSRSSVLPDAPTLTESGLPGFSFDAWIAVIGPAGMPSHVVNDTYNRLKVVLATKEVQEAIHLQGMEIVGNTPAQFGPLLVSELEKHGRLVKRSGATAN